MSSEFANQAFELLTLPFKFVVLEDGYYLLASIGPEPKVDGLVTNPVLEARSVTFSRALSSSSGSPPFSLSDIWKP